MDRIMERNAVIRSVEITNDDHGLLSAWVHLEWDGGGQGFGGYGLYLPKDFSHHDGERTPFAGHFIWRVMEVAGVNKWSELKGKTVRIRHEHSKVHAIGNIIKEDWFNPEEEFIQLRALHGRQIH